MPTVASTINQITAAELNYAPAVIAGVQIAESANADGASKAQAVVNGIIAGSQALESATQPNVAGIAALVNLTVSIWNALGSSDLRRKGTKAAAAGSIT
jgi:hypothetical protein